MQSADDNILKLMRRKYDVSFYKKTLNNIKTFFPNASIGADIYRWPSKGDRRIFSKNL